MPIVGGSIREVTLDGRGFVVPADTDSERDLGGDKNDVQYNGDGSGRLVKTVSGWSIENLAIAIDDDNGDQAFLQQLANQKKFFPVTVTYASGKIFQGTGQITGELKTQSMAQTAPISLGGSGELTPQN